MAMSFVTIVFRRLPRDQVFLNGTVNRTIGTHFNPWDQAFFPVGPRDPVTALPAFELAFNQSYEVGNRGRRPRAVGSAATVTT